MYQFQMSVLVAEFNGLSSTFILREGLNLKDRNIVKNWRVVSANRLVIEFVDPPVPSTHHRVFCRSWREFAEEGKVMEIEDYLVIPHDVEPIGYHFYTDGDEEFEEYRVWFEEDGAQYELPPHRVYPSIQQEEAMIQDYELHWKGWRVCLVLV